MHYKKVKEVIHKKQNGFLNHIPWQALVWLIVYVPLISVTGMYVVFNDGTLWDTPGHIAIAQEVQTHFFPGWNGWSAQSFDGFPVNYFYPPLFYYIAACVGFFIPLLLAVKVLAACGVLLTPCACYYFARSYEFSKKRAQYFMLGMTGFFLGGFVFFGGPTWSGKIAGAFMTGNVPAALAIPLVLLSAGYVRRLENKGHWIVGAGLIALTILIHFIGFIVGIFIVAEWLASTSSAHKKKLVLLWLGVVGLIAFWAIPFLVYHTEQVSYFWGITPTYEGIGFLILGIVGSFILIKNKENTSLAYAALCGILVFVGAAVGGFGFDVDRISFVLTLLLFAVMYKVISAEKIIAVISVVLLCFGLLSVLFVPVSKTSDLTLFSNAAILKGNRLIYLPTEGIMNTHAPVYALMQQSGGIVVNGLFAESSYDARPIMNLTRALDSTSQVWSTAFYDFYYHVPQSITRADINERLDRFGIQYIVTTSNLFGFGDPLEIGIMRVYQPLIVQNILRGDINQEQFVEKKVFAYIAGNNALVAPLTQIDFRDVAMDAWTKDIGTATMGDSNGIVRIQSPVQVWNMAKGNEKIELQESLLNQNTFSVSIDSPTNIPVLVKKSYFPNWHAYSQGHELLVYRASPNLMVVYAHGVVTFEFKKSVWEEVSVIISIMAVLSMVGLYLVTRKQKISL